MARNDEIKAQLDLILEEVAKIQNIKNYALNPNTKADYGDGFISQFFTGEVQNKDTDEIVSVAIKKAPFWEFEFNALFNNELLFYNTVFPAMDHLQKEAKVLKPFNHLPNYYCGTAKEPKKEYIAMENLTPDGYVMHDKMTFFDKEHLELVFKTYGKFHALSYVLRNKHPEIYQDVTKDLVNTGIDVLNFVDKQIILSVSATIQALDTEEYKDARENLKEFGKNADKILLKAFDYNGDNRCLVHGDCWSNNILFKYSDSGNLLDIKLLDFQICRDSTPIHDLSYFFYSGACKKDFDNIEYFLQIYYNTFVEFAEELGMEPSEIFSFSVLVNEWKENALLGVIFAIWLWKLKLTNKKEFNKLISGNKNVSDLEHNKSYKEFVEKIVESSIYKENTTSILIHALEYGIIKNEKFLIE